MNKNDLDIEVSKIFELDEDYNNPILKEGALTLSRMNTFDAMNADDSIVPLYNISSNVIVIPFRDYIQAIDEMIASASVQYLTSELLLTEILIHYPYLSFPAGIKNQILSNAKNDIYNEFNCKVYESVYHCVSAILAEKLITLNITTFKSFNFIRDRYQRPNYIVLTL